MSGRTGLVLLLLGLGAALWPEWGGTGLGVEPPAGAVTFAAHVAPLLHQRCAECHRPGGVAPFPLLTYADAKARAGLIAAVTASRAMPPWLPEPGHGRFAGERRLADAEIDLIQRWVAGGAAEGDPADTPPPPELASGWRLGAPDLVLSLREPYKVALGGREAFRNFVLPLAVARPRYVRAVELQPGPAGVVHHATLLVDATGTAGLLDELDPEPGYPGMEAGVPPGGLFIGWSPGRQPSPFGPGVAWKLEPGTDLVLQLHLASPWRAASRVARRIGAVSVEPRIGLYFTDEPPVRVAATIHLASNTIDIPAGEAAHTVRDEFVVPVDVDAVSIYPHAHYLGREVKVWAVLPDATTRSLIWIRRWDFDWQDEYQYAEPVFLPAGTTLRMEVTYDNSTANPRNPSRPPRRVRWGSRSVDEMADVWLRVLSRRPADGEALTREVYRRDFERLEAGYAHRLRSLPQDFEARSRLGHILLGRGRPQEALPHLEAARHARPRAWPVLHNLGVARAELGQHAAAVRDLEAALRLNPRYAATHQSLAGALVLLGRPEPAVSHYEQALALRPDSADAHNNLGFVLSRLGRLDEAERHYREALRLEPGAVGARHNLGALLLRRGRDGEAIAVFQETLRRRPDHLPTLRSLAAVLARQGKVEETVLALERVVALAPWDEPALYRLGVGLARTGRLSEAADRLEQVARQSPRHPRIHRDLGIVRLRQGQVAEAARHLREALESVEVDREEVYVHLGAALRGLGQLDEAAAALEEALRLRPEDVEARFGLASVLAQLARVGEAAAQFREVLRLRSDHAEARRALERLGEPGTPAD